MAEQTIIERETVTTAPLEPQPTADKTYVTTTAPHGDEEVGGALTGAIGGAAVGAVVGGPVGAVVGGAIGAATGTTVGAVDTREKDEVVVTHVESRP
jgi:uncharacterized protein YcfJ